MNYWTQLSIELANQRDYLDQLFQVYPMANNIRRDLPSGFIDRLNEAFFF
ncbi:MAG: hypothetical protein ACOX3W_03850 [Christensenellaceae bacterium]|jgi:hypothetical protein